MGMDFAGLVRRFVEQEFPDASGVVLAGSTAAGRRTTTSDIDLLLIGPDGFLGDGNASFAGTFGFEGEPIEVFAYTPTGFTEWAERGVREGRPVIVRMLVEGKILKNGSELVELYEQWAERYASGPWPTQYSLNLKRYAVSDLLDDLADATDPAEAKLISDELLRQASALVLLSNGRWLGTAKYLVRELRAWDAARAEALLQPYLTGDTQALIAAVEAELERVGGRLQEGFIR